MKEIRISDQPILSLGQTLRITVDGIRYRLFRASVTMAVIAVAVAFLMNILSESLIKRAVAGTTRQRISEMRVVYDWAARLTDPGSPEDIITSVAKAKPNSALYNETAAMADLDAKAMRNFYISARLGAAYLGFFEDLNYARRRQLVHRATGVEIFDALATQKGFTQFATTLKQMKSVRLVGTSNELTRFLASWSRSSAQIESLRRGRAAAIAGIDEARGESSIMALLVDAEGDFGNVIREAGFHMEPETAALVAARAKNVSDSEAVEKTVGHPEARQAIAQKYNVLPSDVTGLMMWKMLTRRRDAEWYLERIKGSNQPAAAFTADRLVELANSFHESEALNRAERLTFDSGSGWMGLGQRLSWLLLVSMLVCGIGISNAMLMTVTERFREIATLKCLGALDGFIMIVFVLESCFLGLAGGTVGALIGGLIGSGRMTAAFGSGVMRSVPPGDLALGLLISIGLGVTLAAIAAVYPALKAARLAPMEAMRIE